MSSSTTVPDGTADEVGTGLEPIAAPGTLFHTDDPVEVVERATSVADALRGVIAAKHLYTVIQGKAHVRVEGWQLLGSMLGVTAVCTHTEPVEGGWKATVEARTLDGRVIGRADALCTKLEKRGPWKNADDYARLSMAQTRATSKALKGPLGFVISLAGYETTPADEMTFAAPDAEVIEAPTPAASDPISEQRADHLVNLAVNAGVDRSLRLAASHVYGSDVGECGTPAEAVIALGKLDDAQADRLEAWINEKAAAVEATA